MVPEGPIVSEGCKRLQKLPVLGGRMLLQQRSLQLLHQIAEADGVLLVVWMSGWCRRVGW
jgi:hypothetical protein